MSSSAVGSSVIALDQVAQLVHRRRTPSSAAGRPAGVRGPDATRRPGASDARRRPRWQPSRGLRAPGARRASCDARPPGSADRPRAQQPVEQQQPLDAAVGPAALEVDARHLEVDAAGAPSETPERAVAGVERGIEVARAAGSRQPPPRKPSMAARAVSVAHAASSAAASSRSGPPAHAAACAVACCLRPLARLVRLQARRPAATSCRGLVALARGQRAPRPCRRAPARRRARAASASS